VETAGQLAPVAPLDAWAPRANRLGAYVHVPFCTKRCGYCSFNTAPYLEAAVPRFLRALATEIALAGGAPWAPDVQLRTVFLGGGTPSLLAADELGGLLDALRARFHVDRDAEVTVECNPESVTRAKLEGYRAAGVDRLSLGVQSLDDAILPQLGRLHDARRARAAFEAARDAGCANLSVDLMYGLPGLDLDGWTRAVDHVLGWRPDHLSAYGLTLDAGSLWGAAGIDGLPAEQEQIDQYWRLARAAEAHGLEHYEISNYARPGYRARHNLVYWRGAEYLASGPGACGFIGDIRYANAKPIARYCAALEQGRLPIESSERLTPRQRLGERLILGLRTSDGVPTAWLTERVLANRALARRVEAWREAGLMDEEDDRLRLTEQGFLLSDALFVELV
jgi:oxygen-independent coproporphyrinogen III oxidase